MSRACQFQTYLRRSIGEVNDARWAAPFPRVEEHLLRIEHQLWMLLFLADGLVLAERPALAVKIYPDRGDAGIPEKGGDAVTNT